MAAIMIMPCGDIIWLPEPGIRGVWQPARPLVTRAEQAVAEGEDALAAALANLIVEERADG